MTGLADVILAAAEVEAFCRDHGWQFCFIGGVAVQRWGMPRFTQDVNLTLMAHRKALNDRPGTRYGRLRRPRKDGIYPWPQKSFQGIAGGFPRDDGHRSGTPSAADWPW